MEASADQRQRLVEAIFKRNHIRHHCGISPLNIKLASAKGLNRLLRANLKQAAVVPVLAQSATSPETAEVIPFIMR